MINTIKCGDSAILLKELPDNSIDLVITSPPYYLQRDYNKKGIGHEKTVEEYLDSIFEVFGEVVRIVKPSGNIVYNIGDKYLNSSLSLIPYRFAIYAVDNYPIRLINDITWTKTNPVPRQFTRRLVSSTEPFFHFSKGAEYYYDRNSFCEKEKNEKLYKPSKRLGEKYRKLIKDSELSTEEKYKVNEALDNVIEEVRKGIITGFRIKIRGIHAEAFGGQSGGRKNEINRNGFTVIRLHGKEMKKDIINSAVESIPGIKHTAIFPVSIIREFIKLLCPKGGVVLDPYIGSGTTALASIKEERKYIGIDIDPDYCKLAEERIKC